jgi:hypothetical protein
VSGESAPRATVGAEALERAFGARAVCNACAAPVEDYRVVALFLHETAVVRAYCARCYPAAAEGEYRAGGDGLLIDYADFALRFGAPGPPPPPATPVDGILATLIRDPGLRRLSPGSESFARKRRQVPYPVQVEFLIEGGGRKASFTLAPDGRMDGPSGDPLACARVRELLGRR